MSFSRTVSMFLRGLVMIMCLFGTSTFTVAYPTSQLLDCRDAPDFPDSIPSCALCAPSYDSISSCAQAAPVLANVTQIIFNPGAFIDVIKCACTDTFQSAYPQCVDCFEKTNQTSFLDANVQDLPGILKGVNSICGLVSTLLGNVSDTDGETTPSSAVATPTPTAASTVANHASLFAVVSPHTLVVGIALVLGAHFVV